jgi:succinate dehydrogenase / fumarate reductase cytochrome b subunit
MRPLSPHLSIYKWQITNSLSILHRLAGVGLFFGLIILNILFVDSYYNGTGLIHNFWGNKFGYLISNIFLLLIILGFSYHFVNGIRYLYFDITTNISNRAIQLTAYAMLFFASILATFLCLIIIL